MAGFYVKRGEKVAGPFESAKLKQLVAAGKVLPTDTLAKDAAGPWAEASRTSLFANKPEPASALKVRTPAIVQQASAPLVPIVEHVSDRSNGQSKQNRFNVVITTVGRGTLAAGSAVVRSLSIRSQRRHELKLAKVQATAATPTHPAPPAPVQVAQPQPPAIHITNVNTNVVNVGGSVKRWNRLVAFLLSCFIPGLGQLYKGQLIRGVLWFIVVAFGYVFIVPGLVLHILCALSAAMGDPYR